MLNAPFQIVMYVTDAMWCYEPLKSAVLTNHTCHWYYYYYVIRSCVICHGGSHASGACLMGISIRNPLFSSDRLCTTINYSYLTWPTSVFVRECGLNLADAVMQRSMFHFGRCRHCYFGALLSGSGHYCPFRVRAPVDFLHGRTIIGLRKFCPLSRGVGEVAFNMPRCNL